MTKEVAKKASTEVALPSAVKMDSLPSEYNPSYLQLMQGSSDLVKDGTFNTGDWVVSETQELIGSKKDKPKFVVLGMRQAWVIEQKSGDKWFWVRNEGVTPENDNRDWRWEDMEGNIFRAVRTYWLYLLPVERADDSDFSFIEPLVLRMGSTASRVAQNIKKQIIGLTAKHGCEPYQLVFEMSSKLVKKADNSWLEVTARPLRKTTEEEDKESITWVPTINGVCAGKIKTDDSKAEEVKDSDTLDLKDDDVPF